MAAGERGVALTLLGSLPAPALVTIVLHVDLPSIPRLPRVCKMLHSVFVDSEMLELVDILGQSISTKGRSIDAAMTADTVLARHHQLPPTTWAWRAV